MSNPIRNAAYKYRELGFSFYPQIYKVKAGIKGQEWSHWQHNLPTDNEIEYQFSDDFMPRNIAIITGSVSGNLVCLDFDNETDYEKWTKKYPLKTATEKTSRGYHVLFRVENMPKFSHGIFEDSEVELKGNAMNGNGAHCFTTWPSVHENGHEYYWITPPWESLLTLKNISDVGIEPMKIIEEVTYEPIELPNLESKSLHPYIQKVLESQLGQLRGSNNGNRNNNLYKTAASIYSFVKTGNLSKSDADYQIRNVCNQIGIMTGEEQRKTEETLKSAWNTAKPKSIPESKFIPASGQLEYNFVLNCARRGEKGDGELFAKLFEDKAAYDPYEGRWYIWTGSYWQYDDTNRIFHSFSNAVGAEYLECQAKARRLDKEDDQESLKGKVSALNSHSKVEGALEWVKDLLVNREWNKELSLLAFENGTLDLMTGTFRDSDPQDYLRIFVPREWRGLDEPAPKFEKFLLETQGNDIEMVEYLKRLIFLALLGRSNKAILPIFWGELGRNGKSTFMRLMRDIFGNAICDLVDKDVIFQRIKYGGGPSPELYKLRDLRIAFCIETNEGEILNPARVKQLTGHDPIIARLLNMNPISFEPTHTLFLVTNAKPKIPEDAGSDEALWYRLKLVPWTQQFIDDPVLDNQHKVNENLDIELLEESSGIIASIVKAGLRYLEEGLTTPNKVLETTKEYREESDIITRWKNDNCIIGEGYKTEIEALYENYVNWFNDNETGEPKSKILFGKDMKKLFAQSRSGLFRYWLGVAIASTLPTVKIDDF